MEPQHLDNRNKNYNLRNVYFLSPESSFTHPPVGFLNLKSFNVVYIWYAVH